MLQVFTIHNAGEYVIILAMQTLLFKILRQNIVTVDYIKTSENAADYFPILPWSYLCSHYYLA